MNRLKEAGTETLTDPVLHAIRHHLEPMRDGINKSMRDALTKPGRKAVAYNLLYDCEDAWVMALLTLRTVMDGISKPRRVQTLAVRVGREMETEMRLRSLEKTDEGLYVKVSRQIKESPHAYRREYRRKVWIHTANKTGVEWDSWTEEERYLVGMFLIDALVRSTGLARYARYKNANGRGVRIDLVATDELIEWLEKQHELVGAMRPKRLPMLCPPRPWVARTGGGYLTPEMRRPLLRVALKEYRDEYTAEKMPIVFGAVNYLQSVPYRVNDRVLETALYLWDSGLDLPEACSRLNHELPLKPGDGCSKDDWASYKTRAREVNTVNEQNKGRRLAVANTLDIARRDRGRPIWFPHDLDFRGRTYSSAQYLSPQGSDLSKGLILFDEALPLGKDGAWWLAVHVANAFGVDKLKYDERVAWATEHTAEILAVASDPIENTWWHEADNPFVFLAAATEWAGYIEQGDAYPCRLPITVDGTCNGIQHLAAMSRDSEAGRLVNLTPGDKPSDIYARVAEVLEADVTSATTDPDDGMLAELWLHYGIDRGLTKRPTMILPYRGTMSATRNYTSDHVAKRVAKTGTQPFGLSKGKAIGWMAKRMWDAMAKVVIGPLDTMNWASKVASVASEQKQACIWRSPSGFLVVQVYRKTWPRRIKTRIGDVAYRATLRTATDELDAQRQSRAVAPNWIHSNDAAALHVTCVRMRDLSIRSMLAVHDSYGSHACNMTALSATLRGAFVDQYQDRDVREDFSRDIATFAGVDPALMPEPPALGDLDIAAVLESPYFFG